MVAPKCPECNSVCLLVPAGVSKKTNRPFPAFWACPNKDWTINDAKWQEQQAEDPVKAFERTLNEEPIEKAEVPDPAETIMTKDDWIEKERRGIRKTQMQVLLGQGMSLGDAVKQGIDLEEWENYVMEGLS